MDRSKDRTMYRNGYDEPFEPRRQREMPNDRYQDDYDGEDIYQEIMNAGRKQQPSYDQDYMGRTPMQSFEPEYDTYNYQEPPRTPRQRTMEQEPLYSGRMKEPSYVNERMPNMGAQDSYGYGGGFSNEPIDSLLDNNFSQPIQPRSTPYEGTSQYQSMDAYSQQELPPRRSRNMSTMQDDAFLPKDQTSSFRYEEPLPRRGMRQPERQSPLQETQRMRLRPQMEQMETGGGYPQEEDAAIVQPKPRKASMTLSEEFEASKKSRIKKEKKPKLKRKESTHVEARAERVTAPVDSHSLREFAKWNIIIFLAAFVNIVGFTLVTASFVYMSYFNNFALQSDLVTQIIQFCILLSLIFAYITAGLHCGYHMFINKIKPLHPALKIILSPFILIFTELAGVICEIPYLIYCVIKA